MTRKRLFCHVFLLTTLPLFLISQEDVNSFPAFKNSYLNNSINISRFNKNIVSLTHPFEFLNLRKNKNNLFSQSIDEIISNFKLIFKSNYKIKFKSLENF